MSGFDERRCEPRLRYHWPVWYAPENSDEVNQGQMVDITSVAAAFTCHDLHQGPYPFQHIKTRFSVPLNGPNDSFEMRDFVRDGMVQRVERISDCLNRVVVSFHEPLPLKPAQQHAEAEELMAV